MDITTVVSIAFFSAFVGSIAVLIITSLFRTKDHKNQQEHDDYFTMLVHDIRAPLSVIRGSVDILLHEEKNLTKEDVAKMLNQMRDTSDEVLALVGDILDVSKIEAGKFEIVKATADLNLLIQSIADRFIAIANQSNIKIATNLDTSLPKINFDAEKIERVLNNLLSNSLKFTPNGGEITISSEIQGDMAKVSIADTGIGVDDAMKKKLFHKFVQAGATSKSRGKGTGLGLTISKEIVQLHGGTIWIEDNVPKGSIFIFTLPIS